VLDEIKEARQLNRPIIPLIVDTVDQESIDSRLKCLGIADRVWISETVEPLTATQPTPRVVHEILKLGMCLTQVAATLARGMAVLSWPGIRPTISS
jgi:hypothetical protein